MRLWINVPYCFVTSQKSRYALPPPTFLISHHLERAARRGPLNSRRRLYCRHVERADQSARKTRSSPAIAIDGRTSPAISRKWPKKESAAMMALPRTIFNNYRRLYRPVLKLLVRGCSLRSGTSGPNPWGLGFTKTNSSTTGSRGIINVPFLSLGSISTYDHA